ncbi:unnamed protein product [Paramecium pentaurelia]|uniref:Uncharacterized protein n=1 Tax=Paramecium pentaurelia TaxID=43138 RepID=A0A8S1VMX4_9CILI|nr:unnamed protein product [Paramecium pentaurelia]
MKVDFFILEINAVIKHQKFNVFGINEDQLHIIEMEMHVKIEFVKIHQQYQQLLRIFCCQFLNRYFQKLFMNQLDVTVNDTLTIQEFQDLSSTLTIRGSSKDFRVLRINSQCVFGLHPLHYVLKTLVQLLVPWEKVVHCQQEDLNSNFIKLMFLRCISNRNEVECITKLSSCFGLIQQNFKEDQKQVGIVFGMVLVVLIEPVQIQYKLHTITAMVYLINAQ